MSSTTHSSPERLSSRVDGARHDVARRQVGHLVVLRHEGVAAARAQDPALAAHGLADQEGLGLRVEEAGGVELHELHVGDRGARPVRHGHAVARRDVRIARVEVDLAGAARGEHRDARAEASRPGRCGRRARRRRAPGRRPAGRPSATVSRSTAQWFSNSVMLGMRRARVQQHRLDLAPGGVAVVQDAALGVAALASEVEGRERLRVRVADAVELHAQLDQRLDHRRAALDHEAHDLLVAQPRAGAERVPDVILEGVLAGQHRGDPALRPVGGRVGRALLGDDPDAAGVGHPQGEEEARDAGADHQKVEVPPFQGVLPGACVRHARGCLL